MKRSDKSECSVKITQRRHYVLRLIVIGYRWKKWLMFVEQTPWKHEGTHFSLFVSNWMNQGKKKGRPRIGLVRDSLETQNGVS